jgi:hypothetical protein
MYETFVVAVLVRLWGVVENSEHDVRGGKGIGGCKMRSTTIYTLTFPELFLTWL